MTKPVIDTDAKSRAMAIKELNNALRGNLNLSDFHPNEILDLINLI